MGKSATILGRDLHLTGEEMNELLKRNGLLEGDPGQYEVTEAGKPYATERYEHRGTGGYACYNRDWTVRTWDDSVLDTMDTSPEMIQEVRDSVSERRRIRRMATIAEDSGDDFCANEDSGMEEYGPADYVDPIAVAKGTVVVGAIIGIALVAPHIKRLLREKVKPACERVWCKVTKKPYEEPDTKTELDGRTVNCPTDQKQ